jgi:polyisoprenoid-binding protein YceI
LVLGLFLYLPQFLHAQAIYKAAAGQERNIKVSGTSNVHDWVMNSTAIDSQGRFNFDGKNILRTINAFSFSLNAKSLKSEHDTMDKRTYKLLKADQHPKITYKLNSSVVTKQANNNYLIKSTGTLTIAGVSQTVFMDVIGVVNSNNTITCSGSKTIKLTDYKLTPPSYMGGAMKVGNELTINFAIAFKRSNEAI